MVKALIEIRPEAMDELLAEIAHDELDPGDAIVAAWMKILGTEAWLAAESIDPTAYAIPEEQWKAICQALLTRFDQVNAWLDWMNVGPSAFTDVTEEVMTR